MDASLQNSLASGFSLIVILVPRSKSRFAASLTTNVPSPSETHATPGHPSALVCTSTLSATIKLE